MVRVSQLTVLSSCLLSYVSALAASLAMDRRSHSQGNFIASPIISTLTKVWAAPAIVARVDSEAPQALPAATTPVPITDGALVTTTSTATPSSASAIVATIYANEIPLGPRNHNVAVAQNETQFTPSTLKNIPVGDTLTFYFYPSNYSIVQSSFAKPCQPLESGAVFSGFHPTENANSIAREKFIYRVISGETLWFYGVDGYVLSKGGASTCERGMAMVLNPIPKEQADGRTLGNYKKIAANLTKNGVNVRATHVPESISGGDVRGISEKQKANWELIHPIGGNVNVHSSGTGIVNDAGGNTVGANTTVANFQNAGISGKKNRLMAVVVLVGASMFGLGL